MEIVDPNADCSWMVSINQEFTSVIMRNGSWQVPEDWPINLKRLVDSVPIWNDVGCCLWRNTENVSNKLFSKEFFAPFPNVSWHRFVWHKHSSIRFSSYGWLAIKNGLKTADNLLKRGILVNPYCTFCQDCRDSHTHLFFECDFSFGILNFLIPQSQTLLLRPNLYQIFDFIEDISDTKEMLNFFCLLINTSIYYIWRARNDRIFGNNIECITTVGRKIKKAVGAKLQNWKNGLNLKHLLC
ncbi:uncharacterized protein LOC110107254 [Dendrobium catenatum]|uniref:uncharacterized protein LOC110107254 n=1 Tax=Dendrobium catenatum TaxID=906689 RepID=UPI0009F64CF8|nr:uncharacterized protein LOC110107254 [Dendrobium catenatum]